MKAKIKNWTVESLDDAWFAENGKEREGDSDFLQGSQLYPLKEIPFFFSVECLPAAFALFMGQLLGAAVSGEVRISEPNTLLPLVSLLASPLDDEIEVTPDWLIDAGAVSKFASARGLYWLGDEFQSPSCHPSTAGDGAAAVAVPGGSLRPSAAKKVQNTLLCILAAMADQAGIDPSERGAAARIAEWTEHIGAPISEDTVLSVLKMIPDAIARRSK